MKSVKFHHPCEAMKEIGDMLDEAETAFEAGDYMTNDEVFHHHKESVAV